MKSRLSLTLLTTAAVLATGPVLAQQRDGTPGNPPSTETGRAVDRAQGQVPRPDGTPGNPPGTAAGRAVDRTLDTNISGANPQGTAGPAGTAAAGATAGTTAADTTVMRDGLRASKLVGSNVYNEENESIGEIDDLLIARQGGGQPVAVLSVGGFLGIGAKRVAIPFERLQYNAERDRWTLPGATKDSLRERPSFAYSDDRRGGPRDTATGAPDDTARRGTMGGGPATTDRPAAAPPATPAPAR
ncbi:PRC-barrel domain-containing protein [Roseicella aerolata]|uniref:PRC-barrel domain-containing protein n=1 Tax=Roseicella aerolata TaxID=2883479 RepID=A0A9X1IFI3_9PROT|nr:PRC-barrel domain-containing protein [Roseicella aerolata]MCB4822768.1 PRC-barrel domain-containing protein [Roseicella aerolata]